MGMFDWVDCEVPLPDGWIPERELQTKDFDSVMTIIKITKDGRLMEELFDQEVVPKEERPYPDDAGIKGIFGSMRRISLGWKDLEFHGWFSFYGNETYYVYDETGEKGKEYVWHEYKAKFTDGQLREIIVDDKL